MAPAPTPTPTQAAAPKLPASADFNALYNRISLASAKQATFLSSMRAKYPSLARASSSSSSSTTTATNGAFSSLSKPPASSSTQQPSSSSRIAGDDSDLRFENPNTGLGYTAPKSEEKTSAATRELSRRLLGKRGRGGEDVGAQRRRAVPEEESEEEEGRSALGRKKKRARTEEEENAVHPAADAMMREGEAEADVIEAAPKEQQDTSEIGRDEAVTARDGQPETSDAKKKKRKKKNRNKKTKVADGAGDA